MLTRKAKYALKAVLYLAREYGRGPVLVSDLAHKEDIPKKFLELILLELRNLGILQSKKGKGGGYYLSKPPTQVTFGQVIRAIDGPLAPLPCVSQTAYAKCDECADEYSCGTRLVMKEVRDATAEILDNTDFATVLERVQEARTGAMNAGMYYI